MADSDVIPGIFETEFAAIEQKVALAAPFARRIHIDFADGSMVDTSTPMDFPRYRTLIDAYPHVSFEAHLMVAAPEKYLRGLVDAGFTRLIVHVESNDPRRFLEEARFDEVEVGIAIDGATELREVEPFLEEVDMVVVLTKEAGAEKGSFLQEAVEKIKLIRQNYPDLAIEAVGGITDQNVRTVRDAGATRVVSTAFIFSNPASVGEAIETLKTA